MNVIHILTDEELKEIIDSYVEKEAILGGSPNEHTIGKIVRDAIEEKLLAPSDWLKEKAEENYNVDFYE